MILFLLTTLNVFFIVALILRLIANIYEIKYITKNMYSIATSATTVIMVFFILMRINYISTHKIQKHILTSSEYIYSIGVNTDRTTGSFILGTGVINSMSMYSYFVKNSDNSKQKKFIDATITKIYEGNYVPHIVFEQCISSKSFDWIVGVILSNNDCEFKEQVKMYLPSNSVINAFNIK